MTMRLLLPAVAVTALLVGCATSGPPVITPPAHLFADQLFGAPTDRVGPEQIFALTDEMRRYAHNDMALLIRKYGPQGALVEALYQRGQLKLEYESTMTRNASQAFEARTGNCLSLVIMTAAFAKELGMQVRYQSAYLEEAWSRRGDLLLKSGHVNLTLGKRLADSAVNPFPYSVTIDFLPADELRGLKTHEVPESAVIAMFMNNRAVEALVDSRLNDAYAWAREAVRADPEFLAAQNTLGVIYLRRNALPQAAAAFEHVLAEDSEHTRALANLATVAQRQGRAEEAARLRARLARLEPEPPLHFFNLGLAAMRREDYRAARDLFAKEISRGDTSADVHFWLGIAHYRIGDFDQASRELRRAAEASASRSERDLYAAKLDWLRAHTAQ